MIQVEIISKSGNKYYCSDNTYKTPIGNTEHRIGSLAWADGDFLTGGQQHSNRVPYVPSDSSECILELIDSGLGDGVGYVALLEIKKDGFKEIRREKLKFNLDYMNSTFYKYFVYDANNLFFINADGGMKEYKKINEKGVENKKFSSGLASNNVLSINVINGEIECITNYTNYSSSHIPDSDYYKIYNIVNNVITFKKGVFSIEKANVEIFGDYCIEIDSVYDIYKKSSITYMTALTNGRYSPNSDVLDFDILHGVSSNNNDYQQYNINTVGGAYDMTNGLSNGYTLNKKITFVNTSGKTSIEYSLTNADGTNNIKFNVDGDTLANEQKDLFRNPTTAPTLDIGKKYMILTVSYPTDYYLSRKRFVFDLKTTKAWCTIIWLDKDKINEANVNNPIITKKQGVKLLGFLKDM